VITIGLTGGIGTGKSVAAAALRELGATIIDADKVGHEVYLPGTPCWQDLVDHFGREILDPEGSIDRKKLGARVFSDGAALERLNGLVHPRIAAEIARRILELRAEGSAVPIVVEAAVLIEAGWQSLVDEIWVVTTSREHALARVTASRGLSRAEVERRIASQISDAQRTREAAAVIVNDGTPAELRSTIERLWHERVVPRAAAGEG
jgi:dephospho-CoA kinase